MTVEGWKKVILIAAGSPKMLEKLALYLNEVDEARQVLQEKGYGVTGTPISEQVRDIPSLHQSIQVRQVPSLEDYHS